MKEIEKLKKLLEEEGIPFEYTKQTTTGKIHRILYPNGENTVCEVVQESSIDVETDNLLVITGLLTIEESENYIVVGHLMAEDIYYRIKRHWIEAKSAHNE